MSQWQPIETAPKDGTEILVAEEGEVFVALWILGDWLGPRAPSGYRDIAFPTHWQPLPEPPHD